jgi:tetratricopeptide (TPR) repeat protein
MRQMLTLTAATLLLTQASLNLVHAADPVPPPPPPAAAPVPASPLAAARAQIKAKNWAGAIDELRRVNATGDADWNNLMGYALRKQATPDLDGAQRFYDAALRISPQHRGALEYAGELALMKGDLATAEARLAVLAKACPSGCEELDDLKKSVARFKATGKL